MALQTLTAKKTVFQTLYYIFFLLGKFVRFLWIDGREIRIVQRIFFAV